MKARPFLSCAILCVLAGCVAQTDTPAPAEAVPEPAPVAINASPLQEAVIRACESGAEAYEAAEAAHEAMAKGFDKLVSASVAWDKAGGNSADVYANASRMRENASTMREYASRAREYVLSMRECASIIPSNAREYASNAREYASRARANASLARENASGADEAATQAAFTAARYKGFSYEQSLLWKQAMRANEAAKDAWVSDRLLENAAAQAWEAAAQAWEAVADTYGGQ